MSLPSPQDNESEFSLEPALRRRLLWGYFRRYKGLFALGAFFLILTNALALAIPFYLGDAVQTLRDAAADESADLVAVRTYVVDAAKVIIVLAIGAGIARVFSRITIFNAGRHIEFDVRNDLYAHAARLSPAFYNSIATGDLTSRVTNDVTYVRLLYAITYLHIINAVVAYGIAISRMANIDLTLTLMCLAPYPVLLFGVRNVIRALFNQTKIVQKELSNLSSRVQENLTGVDVIKSYVLQDREIRTFGDANGEFLNQNITLAKIRATLQAAIALIASAGTLVVLIVGSRRVINETMTLGAFVEFNAYVVALVFPTIALGWVLSIWHRGLAAFDRVSEVLQREPLLTDPGSEGTPLPSPDTGDVGGVEFRDVTFSYDDDGPVLKNISLSIPPGSTVAIVGKTGAGKSTLVHLIGRMFDPDSGEILVDGVPLRDCSLRQLRAEIGAVPQEPFLFSMSIGQNIRFGLDSLAYDGTLDKRAPELPLLPDDNPQPVSQEDRIQEASDIASLSSDISGFKEGLDTMVGERGVTLSGGQKQRVTIARALLVDPRILILDDALSSVDTRTERRILEQLKVIMAGRTSIMITHRFNALSDVDRIFVLDDGELIEAGTHDELLAADGHYAAMYHRQKLEEELQAGGDP